jgi:hypothetical protein
LKEDKYHGPRLSSPYKESRLEVAGWYLDGEEVSKEEYAKAAAQDPDLHGLEWPEEVRQAVAEALKGIPGAVTDK